MLLRILTSLLAIALLSGCATCPCKKTPAFTAWMTYKEMDAYLAPLEKKADDGKNFWDRRHWVTAVEGRWEKGIPQFRIRVADAPADGRYSWYWWFNQDQTSFNQKIHDLSDKGFTLVQHNAFAWPDGTLRYSGVWQKITPP